MRHDWSRLFSASGFRWQMGLRAGDAQSFFAPTLENRDILAERSQLLDESPADYAVLTQTGLALLEETRRLALAVGVIAPAADRSIESLGRALEPDFVLLLPSSSGPVVVGGVVCFPSSWALPDKIGRTLDQTHAPVPALNSQLSERIRTALDRLAPGTAWERDNWGLARDANRNHHPRRPRKRLDETVEQNEVWLRVERQILYRLPDTGGILFGIRLEITPWDAIAQIEDAAAGLRRGLETMPDDIAAYKGLASAKDRILSWLRN
jgi:dimethylamine monooxygenase subunit A